MVFSVGASHSSVALPLAICVTAIGKAGRETLVVPLLTLMVMFGYVARSASVGVPDNFPVAVLKVAQVGAFCILKVSAAPFGFVVVGVKRIS